MNGWSFRMFRRRRSIAVVFALTSAMLLPGCSTLGPRADRASNLSTASTAPVSYDAVAGLAKQWEANRGDLTRGLAYADALESIGQTDQQFDVYRQLAELNPGNAKLAGIYGRKLVAAGRSKDAVSILEQAEAAGGADWRIYSALGSAYDDQGLYDKARAQYQKALALDARNLSVMNNLGMSYALEGNLKQAEATLRQADAMPRSKSEPRIRQNLALVVGLQGRFDEASSLASEDLPPDQVAANMAYLKKMLSQPNTWQQISEGGQG